MAQIGRWVLREPRDPRTYAIIGAAMEVHRVLGFGFLERVYQESLAVEMTIQDIPFEREVDLTIPYKGSILQTRYRSHFVCFGEVIVECKAIGGLTTADEAQVINYLNATGYKVGLLLNFGGPSLAYRRFVN